MKPSLLAQPYSHYFSNILKMFEEGKPLLPEQINFLSRHEKLLSSHALAPVLKYYLKACRSAPAQALSLKFPAQSLTKQGIYQIKYGVQNLLRQEINHVDLSMTLKQFNQFKLIGIDELIFWHGNHFLTGAPFYPGGIPCVLYFQWGNLFGVVKLHVLPEEKSLKGNVLIYFEDMEERNLYQCVKDYMQQHKEELNHNYSLQHIDNSIYQSPGFRPSLTVIDKHDGQDG